LRILERVLFALVGLLLITLITVLFVVPQSVSEILVNLEAVNIIIRLAVVLVLDILVLAFMFLQLRPRPVNVPGLVVKAPGALADISVESARSFILSAVQKVPDVVSTEARLEAVRGKAKIDMDVVVRGREVNIPRKQQEINQALKRVINKQLGLDILGRPQVHIQLESDQPKVIPSTTPPPAAVAPAVSVTPSKPESTPIFTPARKEPLVTPPLETPKIENEAVNAKPVNHNNEDTDDTIIP
jgi:hypothetical protein